MHVHTLSAWCAMGALAWRGLVIQLAVAAPEKARNCPASNGHPRQFHPAGFRK